MSNSGEPQSLHHSQPDNHTGRESNQDYNENEDNNDDGHDRSKNCNPGSPHIEDDNAVFASSELAHSSPPNRPDSAALDPAFDPDQTISTQFDRFIDLASSHALSNSRLHPSNSDRSQQSRASCVDSAIASPELSDYRQHYRSITSPSGDNTSAWLANRVQHTARPYQPLSSRPSSLFRQHSVGKNQSGEGVSRSSISPSTLPVSSSRSVAHYTTNPHIRESPRTPSVYNGHLARLRDSAYSSVGSPIPQALNTSHIPSRSYHTPHSSNSDRFSVSEQDEIALSEVPDSHYRTRARAPATEYKFDHSVRREIQDIKDRIDRLAQGSHQSSRSVAAMPISFRSEFRQDRPKSTSVAPSAIGGDITSPRRQFRNIFLPAGSPESPKNRSSVNSPSTAHLRPVGGGQYTLLHDALNRAKASLQPSLYRALEALAGDALDLAAMTSDGFVPVTSGGTSVYTSSGVSDRQVRRKAESLCRSVTELAIAMCDVPSFPASGPARPTEAIPAQMPVASSSNDPIRRGEETPEAHPLSSESSRAISFNYDSSRPPTSRALERIEARRSSLYQPSSTATTPITANQSSFPNRSSSILPSTASGALESPSPATMSTLNGVGKQDGSQKPASSFLRRHRFPSSVEHTFLNSNVTPPDHHVSDGAFPPVAGASSYTTPSQRSARSRYSSYANRQTGGDPDGSSLSSANSTIGASRAANSYSSPLPDGLKSPPSAIASLKLRNRLSSNLPARTLSLSSAQARENRESPVNSLGQSHTPSVSAPITDRSQPSRYNPSSDGPRYSHLSDLKSANSVRNGPTYSSTGVRPHSISFGNRNVTLSSSSGSSSSPSTAVTSAITADTARSIMLTPPRATKPDEAAGMNGNSLTAAEVSFTPSGYRHQLPQQEQRQNSHSAAQPGASVGCDQSAGDQSSRIPSLPPSSVFRSKFAVPSRTFQPMGAHKPPSSLFSSLGSTH